MQTTSLIVLIFFSPLLIKGQNAGKDLIKSSIQFHDPNNNWATTKTTFTFLDTRPGKDATRAELYLNNVDGVLCFMRERKGALVTCHIVNAKCNYDIDGNFEPSTEEIEEYNLNEKRTLMLRNYYLYLWGLPMKLNDGGTIIDPEIYEKDFNGKKSQAVRVTYESNVGSDIWYFYFLPETNEMVGYQFFHDEEKGDGEYILLSGLMEVNGMKIPKNRAWYTNPDSTLLGTDHLMAVSLLEHSH